MNPDEALRIATANCRAGQFTTAEALCRGILAGNPQHAGALHCLGVIALKAGRAPVAVDLFSQAIARAPGEARYHSDIGAALCALRRFEDAAGCAQRALALQPDLADAHLNLAEALSKLGRFDEAAASFQRGIELQPGIAGAHSHLGHALAETGRLDKAIASYERALALQPDYPEALTGLGLALSELGRYDDAIACHERALALRPDYAAAHTNLGIARGGRGEFEPALRSCRRAIECKPDFACGHWNLALLLLLLGHHEEGWREYEWRRHPSLFGGLQRHLATPAWDGAPAPGKCILIHAEQGFGDTIQFLRYVPLVLDRSQAARVVVECQPELARLLARGSSGNVEIVARGEALPPFDLHLPMLSLPLALRQFEPLGMTTPYLRAEAGAFFKDAPRAFRAGLAWAGRRSHKDDRRRSIPFEKLAPLLRVRGVEFVSLQVGAAPMDQCSSASVHDFTSQFTDFADTAALIAKLDLVISADTAVAHLAGALGRPVWMLLSFVPDWRWGLGRERTPWYPIMRLFRQRTSGDWDDVVSRVADALERARG